MPLMIKDIIIPDDLSTESFLAALLSEGDVFLSWLNLLAVSDTLLQKKKDACNICDNYQLQLQVELYNACWLLL